LSQSTSASVMHGIEHRLQRRAGGTFAAGEHPFVLGSDGVSLSSTPLRIAVGGAAWPATAAVAPIGAECAVVVRRRLVVAVAAETRGRSLLGARRFLWLRRGRRLAELCR
jgi:hypothetical protein